MGFQLKRKLVKTDSPFEMRAFGREILQENRAIYTQDMIQLIQNSVETYMPDATDEEKNEAFLRAVYGYWAYGASCNEEFYYHFNSISDKEKQEYLTFRTRFFYVNYLNPKTDRAILDDKYALYCKLTPYYFRKMISISKEDDYSSFAQFCQEHESFVIKPVDLGSADGVRRAEAPHTEEGMRELFDQLLSEARSNQKHSSWGRGRPTMVLEELIRQGEEMARMHPASVNVVRMTTLRVDNQIHLFYPWVKFGANGTFVAAAATHGCCALIDGISGRLCSDGYNEKGDVFGFHPNTNIRFQGFQIPEWEKLCNLAKKLALEFDTLRYIGWDFAYSDKGWCVIEANSQADFAMQLMMGRGLRQDLERIIDWHPEKEFWWQ